MRDVFWRLGPDPRRGAPCLFLDRDGVVVEDVGYLHRPHHVALLAGAGELIGAARARGFAVGLVTNQAGVGRGYYGWTDFEAVQAEVARRLGDPEPFDFVAACAAHPDAVHPPLRVADHPWRKPEAGMLLEAAAALDLRLEDSVLVGDQPSDMEAGRRAGVGRLFHVSTGHGAVARPEVEAWRDRHPGSDLRLAADLPEVLDVLGWRGAAQPWPEPGAPLDG